MRLEINGEGKPVLREVDDRAWEYIEGERRKKLMEPHGEHWYFGEQRYDGTVYLTVWPQEDKTEFVALIDKLIEEYGMTATKAAEQLLYAWRRDMAYALWSEDIQKDKKKLQDEIESLKRRLYHGCEGCPHFLFVRNGDDEDGYCTANGKKPLPVAFLYPCKAGEPFHTVKFYPCETCIFTQGVILNRR